MVINADLKDNVAMGSEIASPIISFLLLVTAIVTAFIAYHEYKSHRQPKIIIDFSHVRIGVKSTIAAVPDPQMDTGKVCIKNIGDTPATDVSIVLKGENFNKSGGIDYTRFISILSPGEESSVLELPFNQIYEHPLLVNPRFVVSVSYHDDDTHQQKVQKTINIKDARLLNAKEVKV